MRLMAGCLVAALTITTTTGTPPAPQSNRPSTAERLTVEFMRDFAKRRYKLRVGARVNFDPKSTRLALDFAGVSRILAGSDYPHQIGSIPKMKQSIGALGLSAEDG